MSAKKLLTTLFLIALLSVSSHAFAFSLAVEPGVADMELKWSAPAAYKIYGFNIYRAEKTQDGLKNYKKINADLVQETFYLDKDASLVPDQEYLYQVGAVDFTGAEFEYSSTGEGAFRALSLWIPKISADPSEGVFKVPVNARNLDGLQMSNANITIVYDSGMLECVDVEKTSLMKNYSFTSNNKTPGVFIAAISTGQGEKLVGEGTFFYLSFRFRESAKAGDTSRLAFNASDASLKLTFAWDENFKSIPLTLVNGEVTASTAYKRGDVDGDGEASKKDVAMVLKMAVGQIKPDEKQKNAGDLDGDGEIGANDAYLIDAMISSTTASGAALSLQPDFSRATTETKDTWNISVGSGSGKSGGLIDVPVEIKGSANYASATIGIQYDKSVLKAMAASIPSSAQKTVEMVHFIDGSKGTIKISLIAKDVAAISEAVALHLKFKVLKNGLSVLNITSANVYGKDGFDLKRFDALQSADNSNGYFATRNASGTGILVGMVVSQATGFSLPLAEVSVPIKTVKTNGIGAYFMELPAGKYPVTIRKSGYSTGKDALRGEGGKVTLKHFLLRKK
ncbi:MAG: hypothetical protein HZA01_02375 [Nitrospinae bacterium]|nr:hypothetical protein [Nitrospinota bacterium]